MQNELCCGPLLLCALLNEQQLVGKLSPGSPSLAHSLAQDSWAGYSVVGIPESRLVGLSSCPNNEPSTVGLTALPTSGTLPCGPALHSSVPGPGLTQGWVGP